MFKERCLLASSAQSKSPTHWITVASTGTSEKIGYGYGWEYRGPWENEILKGEFTPNETKGFGYDDLDTGEVEEFRQLVGYSVATSSVIVTLYMDEAIPERDHFNLRVTRCDTEREVVLSGYTYSTHREKFILSGVGDFFTSADVGKVIPLRITPE